VIFRVGTHQGGIKRGDDFFIISPSSKIVRGTIKETLHECEPYSFISDNVVLGLLSLDSAITWSTPEKALLGKRGKKPLPSQVGSLVPLRGETEKKTYLDMIRARIPTKEQMFPRNDFSHEVIKISSPRSVKEYIFATADHAELQEYLQLGDKALKSTGFLFVRRSKTLLVEESYLTDVIAVTDLDDNGIYEMLIHSGGYSSGKYEIWLFDGKKFTGAKRTIYKWID
jgi:hypothetical protein